MRQRTPEHLPDILLGSGSLAILLLITTGSFSRQTLDKFRQRSKERFGAVVSEKTGKRSAGIPLDGAHFNHYEGQHHPNYNRMDNGQLLTIYEHLQQHRQAHLLPHQEGLPPEKQMLDNGLSVVGNERAIELMEISVAIFEAIVFQREREIERILDQYEQQGSRSSTLDLETIETVIDETLGRYDHFRDLSPKQRQKLIQTIQAHRQEIGLGAKMETAPTTISVR